MSLNEEDRKTLVKLYLDRARKTFLEAKVAVEAKSWNMAANRLFIGTMK